MQREGYYVIITLVLKEVGYNMNVKKIINPILLTVAALIWGVAFVAQDIAAQTVKPFGVIAVRSYIAVVALIPVILIMGKKAPQPIIKGGGRRTLILGGVLCGTALFAASFFQQLGIEQGTDPGKAGFLTALYIIIVAVFGIIVKRKFSPKIMISVAISIVGLYLLCVTSGSFAIQISDLLVFACAFIFATHILVIDHFSPRTECVKMACIQFFVCGTLSLIAMFAFGEPTTVDGIISAALPLLFLGIGSSGIAYTLQIIGQRNTDPTLASILMSLESVFAVLAGLLFGDEMNLRKGIGCALMFFAIILAQLPDRKKG